MFRNAVRGFRAQGVLSGAHRRTHIYASYASMRSVITPCLLRVSTASVYCVPALP
jgi:hypothetical protein